MDILGSQDLDRIARDQRDDDRRFGRKMTLLIVGAYAVAFALGALAWVLT